MEEQLNQPLSSKQWLGLRLHLAMCSACRKSLRYARSIRQWLRSGARDEEALSPEAMERIRQALDREL